MKSKSPRSSSQNQDVITDAVIVGCATAMGDAAIGDAASDDRAVAGSMGLGPIRLPKKNADEFISNFNQHYRSLGLELQKQQHEKIPDSHETAGDLNEDSSTSATDHRT